MKVICELAKRGCTVSRCEHRVLHEPIYLGYECNEEKEYCGRVQKDVICVPVEDEA